MTRYIDADLMAKNSCKAVCSECDEFGSAIINVQCNCSEMRYRFLRLIDAQPTVELRKHGHWKHDSEGFSYCSECGNRHVWDYNFCPDCGARMVEDE